MRWVRCFPTPRYVYFHPYYVYFHLITHTVPFPDSHARDRESSPNHLTPPTPHRAPCNEIGLF